MIGQYSGWPTVDYLNQLVQDSEPTGNCETHSTGDVSNRDINVCLILLHGIN